MGILVFSVSCDVRSGRSCTVREVDGVNTISCPDGSSAALPEADTEETSEGVDENTGATITEEDPGENCENGGVKIVVGEGTPVYVCDGASATVTTEPPGENCASGGVKVQVGSEDPAYACNGVPQDICADPFPQLCSHVDFTHAVITQCCAAEDTCTDLGCTPPPL